MSRQTTPLASTGVTSTSAVELAITAIAPTMALIVEKSLARFRFASMMFADAKPLIYWLPELGKDGHWIEVLSMS
jgi:hypothetical protein